MKTFKRILVVVLFVLFNSVLFAQNETKSANVIKQRLDSVIYIGGGEKFDYFYDNLGHNTGLIYNYWSNVTMKYEKRYKVEFAYDVNGYCNLNQSFSWDNALSQWIITGKDEKSYDENNQLLLNYSFNWDKTLIKWVLSSKVDYENSYDSKNKLISVIAYPNTISEKKKYEYTYSTAGVLTSILWYRWKDYKWQPQNKTEYNYDSVGNLTERIQSYMGNGDTDWTFSAKYEYKYNNNFSINQLLLPSDYIFQGEWVVPSDFNVIHMIISQTHFPYSLIQDFTMRYYYSPLDVTGINVLETLNTTIFPNPATDFLNIQWNGNQSVLNVEVIDITGKKVFAGMIENNSKLPIQDYLEGLYLVRISDNNKTLKTEKVYFKY